MSSLPHRTHGTNSLDSVKLGYVTVRCNATKIYGQTQLILNRTILKKTFTSWQVQFHVTRVQNSTNASEDAHELEWQIGLEIPSMNDNRSRTWVEFVELFANVKFSGVIVVAIYSRTAAIVLEYLFYMRTIS